MREPKIIFRRDGHVLVNGLIVGTVRRGEMRTGTWWSLKNRFTGELTEPRDQRWRVVDDAVSIYEAHKA
jgi:hypothetical protein